MARASAALAPRSGVPGVLLHGMPGGGKTACALELAYTHEHAFDRLVWFKAPDEGLDITGALTGFALTLEPAAGLPDGPPARRRGQSWPAFLPRLTELLERQPDADRHRQHRVAAHRARAVARCPLGAR